MWSCTKCGYSTKSAQSFKYHLIRKVPCDLAKNEETMLKRMREEYEMTWVKIDYLVANADSGNIAENERKIKRLFITLSRYGAKLDHEFDEKEFNELKRETLAEIKAKRENFLASNKNESPHRETESQN